MNLALSVELFFVVIFLWKPRLHLLEPLVVHFGGIDMAADDFRSEFLCQPHTQIDGHIRMVRIIDRDVDGFIHEQPP